jgi:hypothetical protein
MKQQLDTKTIACYTRYVVDILLIYNAKHITFDKINEYVNQIHPNLILNPTHERNDSISFLDLLIVWNQSNLEIDIYGKPTTTDTTINFFSNHPTEHEMAAYRYHINRMLSLPLTIERQQTEWETIVTIARNSNFLTKLITNLKTQMQHKTQG